MPRLIPAQYRFTAGEVTPLVKGGPDLAVYPTGCDIAENFLILRHGGAKARPGTHFVAEVKTSANATRLVPFEYSTTQAYVLELGNLYFRVYKNGGRIESPPGTPVEVVTPWVSADLATLKFTQSADTLYAVHPNYAPQKITRASHTSWSITQIAFVDGPYKPENIDTAQTLTVSTNAVGAGATMTASGTLTFNANMVGSLWRIKGNAVYGYVSITAFTDSTHVTVNVKTVLDFATPGTSTTSKWRQGLWSTDQGFPAADSFHQQRLVFGGSGLNPDRVDGSVSADFENFTPGTTDSDPISFRLVSNKVPSIRWIASERRLAVGALGSEFVISGGTDATITPSNIQTREPTTYGGSSVAPVKIDSHVLFIQRAGQKLLDLSYNIMTDNYDADDLTLLSEHITSGGINYMAWQQEPNRLLWLVRADGQLVSLTYLPKMKVIGWARHTTQGKFESVAVIPHPNLDKDQVWVIANRTINGATKRYVEYFEETSGFYTDYHADAALPYDGTQNGATVTPGATSGTGVTFTASVATFASGDVGKDIVLTAAIAGVANARATITAFTDSTHVTCTIVNAFPNTSAIAAGGWALAVNSVSGLSHLEAATVKILGDGAEYPDAAVSGGVVTLSGPKAYKIEVGLGYTPKLIPLEPVAQDQLGTTMGRTKHWARVFARVYKTLGLNITTEGGAQELTFRKSSDPMDLPPPMLTGDVEISAKGWTKGAAPTFTQSHPLPATILAVWGWLDIAEP